MCSRNPIEDKGLYIQYPYNAEEPTVQIPALNPATISSMGPRPRENENCINGKNISSISIDCTVDKLDIMNEINRLSYIRIAVASTLTVAISVVVALATKFRLNLHTSIYFLLIVCITITIAYTGYISWMLFRNQSKIKQCNEEIERLPIC